MLEVPRSPKPQGVPYGIDYQDPHSVTRVLVDWFGDEEVLVCACDDGDVVAWWVGEIVSPPLFLFQKCNEIDAYSMPLASSDRRPAKCPRRRR